MKYRVKINMNHGGFLDGSNDKQYTCNAEDPGSISESGRSPGGGNGNPTLIFLLGRSDGQRSLEVYSP